MKFIVEIEERDLTGFIMRLADITDEYESYIDDSPADQLRQFFFWEYAGDTLDFRTDVKITEIKED